MVNRTRLGLTAGAVGMLASMAALPAPAQSLGQLYLTPASQTQNGGPYTFDIDVSGGAANAVAWGTNISIDTSVLKFNDSTSPVASTQPAFTGLAVLDADGDTATVTFNSFPPNVLGSNGVTTLGTFTLDQVGAITAPTDITLSAVGFPPNGSGVFDANSNQLIDSVAGAVINPTTGSPVPEPGAWALLGCGSTAVLLTRRRGRA
jgi:hypothetical protein